MSDINTWIYQYQLPLRVGMFVLFLGLFALWETYRPWREWLIERKLRWYRNISLVLISKILIRILFPFLTIAAAIEVQKKGLGLFNQLPLLPVAKFILGFIAMDLVMYIQHRMMHRVSWLWPVHRVHHVDKDLDVTTGVRFHPLEEFVFFGFKLLGVGFFGIGPVTVLVFEIYFNIALMFTHTNVKLNSNIEKWLRYIIVTPVMHRIHHSDIPRESNKNFGFIFSIWDRIFYSFKKKNYIGEEKLILGLEGYRDPKYQTLANLLILPFNPRKLKPHIRKERPTKMKTFEKKPSVAPVKKKWFFT